MQLHSLLQIYLSINIVRFTFHIPDIYIYIHTCLSSILGLQPFQTKPSWKCYFQYKRVCLNKSGPKAPDFVVANLPAVVAGVVWQLFTCDLWRGHCQGWLVGQWETSPIVFSNYGGLPYKSGLDIIYYLYTNDPAGFDWKRPFSGGLTFKHWGHLGYRL